MRWLVALLCLVLSGCPEGPPAPLALGGEVDEVAVRAAAVPFTALRAAAVGDELVLQGQVGKVCPAGCWFYLHGPDDLVYVDALGDLKMPPSGQGRRALVMGRVDGEGGARILQAQRVLLTSVEP